MVFLNVYTFIIYSDIFYYYCCYYIYYICIHDVCAYKLRTVPQKIWSRIRQRIYYVYIYKIGDGNIQRRRGGSGDANETETRKTRLESEMSGEYMGHRIWIGITSQRRRQCIHDKKTRMTSHLCTSKNSFSLYLYAR